MNRVENCVHTPKLDCARDSKIAYVLSCVSTFCDAQKCIGELEVVGVGMLALEVYPQYAVAAFSEGETV